MPTARVQLRNVFTRFAFTHVSHMLIPCQQIGALSCAERPALTPGRRPARVGRIASCTPAASSTSWAAGLATAGPPPRQIPGPRPTPRAPHLPGGSSCTSKDHEARRGKVGGRLVGLLRSLRLPPFWRCLTGCLPCLSTNSHSWKANCRFIGYSVIDCVLLPRKVVVLAVRSLPALQTENP